MRVRKKVLAYAGLALAGAIGGYVYLIGVLRPVAPAVACLMVERDTWRCTSYQIIVSKPFFLLSGALIGAWWAYALVRRYAAPEQRSFTWREGLVAAPPLLAITGWIGALHPGVRWFWGDSFGWWQVLLFFLAAVLARLAIGIASIAKVRGGLILAFGVPIIFASVGYASITLFRLTAGRARVPTWSIGVRVHLPPAHRHERAVGLARCLGRYLAGLRSRGRTPRIATELDLAGECDRAADHDRGDLVGTCHRT